MTIVSADNIRQLLLDAEAVHRLGDFAAAEKLYVQVLRLDARNTDALAMLGTLNVQKGHPDIGLGLINESLAVHSNQPAAWNNRGNALDNLDRHDEAIESYTKATLLNPNFIEAEANLGKALLTRQRFAEAIVHFSRVIALDSSHADAYFRRAIALAACRRFNEALDDVTKALLLDPENIDGHNNRGNVLATLDRPEEALAEYEHVLVLDPKHAEAYSNRGNTLFTLGRMEDALSSFSRALDLKPDYADAQWNKGLALLTLGHFKEGWAHYEWRWQQEKNQTLKRAFSQPRWQGESIVGQTILLHPEQGFGDSIQFARYAKRVADLGAHVLLEAPNELASLFASLDGPDTVIIEGTSRPTFDYYCSLMSLPYILGTNIRTIPTDIPYLSAPFDQATHWQKKLGPKTQRRIGIVWSGGTVHMRDKARSIPVAQFIGMFEGEGLFELHSLQKDYRPDDEAFLKARPILISQHEAALQDFSDTAALIAQMDLVISVDTSVAHLAGAMGKPVWILLPFAADYRWMLNRSDSPWYPTARLFRQKTRGDWMPVFDEIAAALGTFNGSSGYQPDR